MNSTFQNIADLIHFHRKRSGLTQAELAELAGTGKTVVFDVEAGKSTVRWATLAKIFNALNIQMEFKSPLMREFEESEHEKG